MNVADSNWYAEQLINRGFGLTENIKEANIVLINSCTVRQHAEERALSFVGYLKKYKKFNPNLKIIFTGCVAEKWREQLKKRFPQIDLIIGSKSITLFPKLIDQLLNNTLINQTSTKNIQITLSAIKKVSVFVPIIRGCNNYCSYCIVPFVRGEEKYRPDSEIIDEINCLTKYGVKEVTLLGQNVNSYKCENIRTGTIRDFADLLYEVEKIKDLKRIRFLTNHPKDMSDKIIEAVANSNKLCHHIHLPLQSGSNRILELMNRKYDRNLFLSLVKNIRYNIPDVSITTDLMVGFPNESEQDFLDTLDMVNTIKFDFAYVFKYSPRPGTLADRKWGDNIPQEIKEKRHQQLFNLCQQIAKEKNQKFIGKTVEVLVEYIKEGTICGKTSDNRLVECKYKSNYECSSSLIGQIVPIRITDAKTHSLSGEQI